MAKKSFENVRRMRRNFWMAFVALPICYVLAISNVHLTKYYVVIGIVLLLFWFYLSVRTCLEVCPACGGRFFNGAAYFSGRCGNCGKDCGSG